MKGALGSGESGSQSDDTIVPRSTQNSGSRDLPSDTSELKALSESSSDSESTNSLPPLSLENEEATHVGELGSEVSRTATFVPGLSAASSELGPSGATKISQLPVAAPEEYFRSVPLAELASMLEGKRLDHFAVEQMIGGGGMGAVFRGRDLRLDRTVAIKVIPAAKRDPETLRRFRQEAQAAARLDHPHIARVYYIGEAEQWNYIVFEFIDGVNIRDLVAMHGPLSMDDTVFYTRQVAEALSHAHEREVVHRDIKPSNILVTTAGVIKVVDMGLARNTAMDQSSNDATASGVTLGTFDYISPEQARNPRDADVRSDLYSLGCSMFFMLTGKPPFSEGTVLQKLLKHGSVPPPDPRAWRTDVSDQAHAVLMKLMAKQPTGRYQNPKDLISDLLMLAEVEDLPRSQMPGTVMFAPAIPQRSLLESNLPWLVAVAFLLGSTLWLQSVQAFSSGLKMPAIESKPETVGVKPANVSPAEPVGESEVAGQPTGSVSAVKPGDASLSLDASVWQQKFVVSPFRPADVPEVNWISDLSVAVEQLKDLPSVEIEIRGMVELRSLVDASNSSLRIRGNPQVRSGFEVSASLLRQFTDDAGVWLVDNSNLVLEDLNIELDSSAKRSGKELSLFRSNGNTDLRLKNVGVTLKASDSTAGSDVFVVQIEEASTLVDATESGSSEGESAHQEFDVAFEACEIRGIGTLIDVRIEPGSNIPFTASVSGCLVALSDWVFSVDAQGDMLVPQVDRNLRLFCDLSTFHTGQGFARLDYASTMEPFVSLNRRAESCVFSCSEDTHLSVAGLSYDGTLSNLNKFLFKGSDNAYDEGLEIFCKCYDPDNLEIFSYGFQSVSQEAWFLERGNARRVRWKVPREGKMDLTTVTPSDFELDEDRFAPGFRAE